MNATIARLARDESGATSLEYGLVAALVSVSLIGTLSALGFPSLYEIFTSVYDALISA